MTIQKERAISAEQVTEILTEKRQDQLNETVELGYQLVEMLGKSLETYVAASTKKLHAAENDLSVEAWAIETETFTFNVANQIKDLNEQILAAVKELNE